MAFSEIYHCDVCGKERSEGSQDWWRIWEGKFSPPNRDEGQPLLQVTGWNAFQAHSAGTRHVCGAVCAQTVLNRWMTRK